VVGHVLGLAEIVRTPAAVVCGRADVDIDGVEVRSLVDEVGEQRALHDARFSVGAVASAMAERVEAPA
jgi:hypothetical protein